MGNKNDVNRKTECPEGVIIIISSCCSGNISIITHTKAAATNKIN